MTVVHHGPWFLGNRFQKGIDRMFGAAQTSAADSGAWLPPADVREQDGQYLVQVDLPGIDPKAVEITCEQGVLSIRGRREESHPEARDAYRRIERLTGQFQRRFSLPEAADVENIKAKAVHGVLEVAIPKLAPAKPQRIAVQAA